METLIIISLFSKTYLMNWIEYWREFAFVVSGVVAWFAGRKSTAIKLKTDSAGALEALQRVYDKYIEHNSAILQEVSNRLNQVEEHNRSLQKNFNDMSISYSVVMGESKKFEAKYNLLVKEHEQLRVDYECLKIDFDKYKKANK